jgi:hypothetical protein
MVVYHTASDDETKGLEQGNRQWQHDAGRTGEAPAFSSGPRASVIGVSNGVRSACFNFAMKEASMLGQVFERFVEKSPISVMVRATLERALARRRIFHQSQLQDDDLYEMLFWDNSPDFFALYSDPDSDESLDEEESLEDTLRDHTGQPLEWAKDLHRMSEDTTLPDAYLRGVECTRMRVDAHGIAWTCYPKHLDVTVRTSTIPWELLESQRLFGAQSVGH